jgi:AcrR family transcriptional regulator
MNEDKIAKRRNEILAAAIVVFADKGYHATKISDIAETLNIGHGTFYRYFSNKLDIFKAVIDTVFDEIKHSIADEPAILAGDIDSFRAQLRRIGEKLFSVFANDRRIGKIIFYEILGVHPEINEMFEEVMDYFDGYTETFILNGMDRGFLRKGLDSRMISRAVNSLVFMTARDGVANEKKSGFIQRWIDTIILLMLDGMSLR